DNHVRVAYAPSLVTVLAQQSNSAAPPTTIAIGSGDTSSPGPILSNNTPLLRWSPVAGATAYGLYIREMNADGTLGGFVYPNSSGTTTTPLNGTQFQLPPGTLGSGRRYRWNMTSFNGSAEGATSTRRYFQTPPTAVPSPAVAVQLGLNVINDGQQSAVDFGTVVSGESAAFLTFAIRDDGGSALTISNISVPAGFCVTDFPTAT